MMFNSSTNINKKRTTTSQLKQLNTKKARHMAFEIQVMAGLNHLMESRPYLSDNWISNDNTDLNK
jgi:hypothetical protein